PGAARPGAVRVTHIVEPADVDAAVEAWCATETLQEAARRHGYEASVLRLLIEKARAAGDTRVPSPPRKRRGRWRVNSELVDELFAEYSRLEPLKSAATRHGVHVRTMYGWLAEAGIVHRRGVKLDPAQVDAIVAGRRRL